MEIKKEGISGADFLAGKHGGKSFRAPGFRPVGNDGAAEAARLLGRSNAATKHKLASRKGSRSANLRKAIKDYS